MADFKASGLQIMTSVIGSGLLLFVLNNLYSDFNQPHINIQTEAELEGVYSVTVKNDGRASATHLRLTVSFPDANIVNFTTPYHTENISLRKEGSGLLVGEIQRLARDASVKVHLNIFPSYNSYYTIATAYDQGSNEISKDDLFSRGNYYYGNQISLNELVMIITLVLSIGSFGFVFLYKSREKRDKRNASKFAAGILKEAATVYKNLKNEILSLRIFSYEIWDKTEHNIKRQIVNRYDDFECITAFYKKLKERDSELTQRKVIMDVVIKQNEECLQVAEDVLKIDWFSYIGGKNKKTNVVMIIVLIIPSSFFISLVCEVMLGNYLITIIPFYVGELGYYRVNNTSVAIISSIIVIFCVFIVRSISASVISRIITKRFEPAAVLINNIIRSSLTPYNIPNQHFKQFLLSTVVMGTPLYLLLSDYFSEYVFLTLILFDIVRMSILTLIITRYIIPKIGSHKAEHIQPTELTTTNRSVIEYIQKGRKKVRRISPTIILTIFVFITVGSIIGYVSLDILTKSYQYDEYIASYTDSSSGIRVGIGPTGMDSNLNANLIYVANSGSDSVSVIDGQTSDVSDEIPVESIPLAVAVNPVTNLIYVANAGSDSVSVIDGQNGYVLSSIPVLNSPQAIAINILTNKVYVANTNSDTVSVINGTTMTVLENVTVGISPIELAINAFTNKVYVANTNSSTISVIDGQTNIVIANIKVADKPRGISLNPNTNYVYAVGLNGTSIIDGKVDRIVTNIPASSESGGIATNALTDKVYVANTNSSTISVIDGQTNIVIANITVGISPMDITVNPNTDKVYVTNGLSDTVSVINGKTNQLLL